MSSNKVRLYQKKQVNKLLERIRALKSENKSLLDENKHLAHENDVDKIIIENLKSQYKDIYDTYMSEIASIKALKNEYRSTIQSIKAMESDYKKRFQEILNRVKKT